MAVNIDTEQHGAVADRSQPEAGDAPRVGARVALRGIRKTFPGDVIALRGVDLEIDGGEFFTLLGPSGCGKTTVLRIIAGLETPSAGDVTIGDRLVTAIPPHKRNVNTVFQSYALFPHLSVRDNIGFGLRMRGVGKSEIKKRVAATAEFIKIDELLDRGIERLSGGQRQRVALARALINEPDVLLLDEPLSALDAGLRGDLQLELLRIQQRLGMTFVFVTHDQQEAMVMSDRIAVLGEGGIEQVGTPAALYERPDNLFVARFMGHSNVFAVRARRADGIVTDFGVLNGEFEPGSHVLIRPETIIVSADDIDGTNRFDARVIERLYRGSVAEYTLACGDTTLIATCSNTGRGMFENGAQVYVRIPGEGAVGLRE